MKSLTPKGNKTTFLVQLAANTPWHPNHEEAKAILGKRAAEAAEIALPVPEPVAVRIDSINLERFDRDGIELVIDTRTGEAFASQAGYSRMSGIAYATVKKRVERLKGGDNLDLKTAEIETPGGLQGVTLIPAKLVYRWLMKDNEELGFAMGEAGATVYMHQLAGFKISSTATEPISQPEPELTPPPTPQLPPADIRLVNLTDSLKFFGVKPENPRLKQELQDFALDILGIGQPALKSENNEVWCGVVERAEQLGYPATLASNQRVKLGQFVAKYGLNPKKEVRLCNGTQRPINVYRVSDELDRAIVSYFDKLNVSL